MHYFAYGAGIDPRMMANEHPNARCLGAGRLDGYRLEFNVYSERWQSGAANLEPDANAFVWGVVWDLEEEDLRSLDTYVGWPT